MGKQRRPAIPGHARASADDVVAVARGDRDRGDGREAELLGEASNRAAIACEAALVEADEVHLVDREHHVADAEQRDDEACRRVCVSTPLRASTRRMARSAVEAPVAMLRVYCSWPGVSATMKRRCRRRKEAIGDVDGDALLALGLKPVDQKREVDRVAGGAVLLGIRFERGELVLEQQLGIVEQPTDQRRLAVIDAAAGEEAQQRSCRSPRRSGYAASARDRRSDGAAIRSSPRASSSPSKRTDSLSIRRPCRAPRCARRASQRRSLRASRRSIRRRPSADSSRACGSGRCASPALRRGRAACGRRRP